jgi:hypothetical protein
MVFLGERKNCPTILVDQAWVSIYRVHHRETQNVHDQSSLKPVKLSYKVGRSNMVQPRYPKMEKS